MTGRRLALAALLAAVLALGLPPAAAQDGDSSTTTSVPAVPPPDIVPRPNSGTEPTEAGDRGGALQLGLLALLVVVIGLGVVVVVRQSRRARRL